MADLSVAIRLSATDQASPTIGKVSKQVAGIGSAAEESSSKVGGLTSMLGRVGLAAAGIGAVAGAFLGLGKALVDPIMAASDLDESMNKVNVVFGTSAKTVTDFAKTAAQGLGTSQSEALAAAGTFGNLFTSMGLGRQEAAKLSTNILTLGADLASFNNIGTDEALEKLRAGLVGEAEPLRALGVNINDAAVENEALRLGLAKSKKEITDSAKVQARYALIMQQSTNAQGDFKNTSSGMANSLRIIKASFADLQTQIGSRLLPVIAPLVSGFAKALPLAMDALAPMLDRVGALASDAAGAVGGLLGRLGRVLPDLRQLASSAVGFFRQASGAGLVLHNTLERLVGIDVANRLVRGFEAVRRAVGPVTRAISAFANGVRFVVNDVAAFVEGKLSLKDLIANLRIDVGLIGAAFAPAVEAVKRIWSGIDWTRIARDAWANLRAGFAAVSGAASDLTTWLAQQWSRIEWGGVWRSVTGFATGLEAGLGDVWRFVTTWVAGQWAKIDWAPAWKAARDVGAALERSLEPVTSALERWLTASARDVSWDDVWRDARTGPAARVAVATLFTHEDTKPVANAIGQWLGQATLDGFDLVVSLMRTDGSQKMGVGFLAAINQGVRNAGPGMAMSARFFGGEVALWIAEGFGQKIGPALQAAFQRAIAGLQGAVQGAVTGLTPGFNPPGTSPSQPPPITVPTGGSGSVPAFANGGVFRVGGSGGTDSQLVRFRASPGEVVAVGHPRGPAARGGVTINLGGVHVHDQADEERLVARLQDTMESYLTGGLRAARHRGVRFPLGVGAGAT